MHNPALATDLPEHMTYPVSQRVTDGVDLDYSSLLVGRAFAIDTLAYDGIVNSGRPYLMPMARTLTRLREAELLELVDMGALIARHSSEVLQKADLLLADVDSWLLI